MDGLRATGGSLGERYWGLVSTPTETQVHFWPAVDGLEIRCALFHPNFCDGAFTANDPEVRMYALQRPAGDGSRSGTRNA